MANIIKIVLEGSDQTGPAFLSAAKNAQNLSRTFTATLGVGRITFDSLATTIQNFGGASGAQFVNMAQSIGLSIAQLKVLQREAAATGAAMSAAFGAFTVGFAAGAAVMGAFISRQEEEQARAAEGAAAASKIFLDSAQQMLELDDKRAAGYAKINSAIDAQIKLAETLKISESDRVALYQTLDKLRERQIAQQQALEQADEAAGFDTAKSKWEELIQVKYNAQNATLGLMQAEKIRHDKELEQIGELATTALLTEQETNSLIEAERQAHSARLLQIETDRVKKERQLALNNAGSVLSQAGNLFGSLAALSAAYGKKNFGLTQAFRYAEAVVNTAAAVTRALAAFDPPLNFVMAALTAAAGAAQIATIAAAKPTGQAHGGLTEVGSAGSYNLIQGERILAPRQNADLTEFLERGNTGGNSTVNVYLDGMVLARTISKWSRDGLLEIDAKSIV